MKRLLVLLMLFPAISLAEPIAKTIQDAASKMTLSSIQSLLGVEYYFPSQDVIENNSMYSAIKDNYPKIGVVHEVYMGDAMMQLRTGRLADCLIPLFFWKDKTLHGFISKIERNIPLCKQKEQGKIFHSPYLNVGKREIYDLKMKVKFSEKKDEKYKICVNTLCKKGIKKDDFFV